MAQVAPRRRPLPVRIAWVRWRLLVSIIAGIVCWLLAPSRLIGITRGLLGWDTGCALALVLYAAMFTLERERTMAEDAKAQEDGEWTIFAVVLAGVVASFVAIIGDFSVDKGASAAVKNLHVALVASTLLLSWLTTHTVFALRYAHEYYATSPGRTEVDKGLDFPGKEPPDYWDFFYFSLVLGMTFQVSDVQITARKLRRLATLQGLLGFLFNTVIIALTVNIAAGLL